MISLSEGLCCVLVYETVRSASRASNFFHIFSHLVFVKTNAIVASKITSLEKPILNVWLSKTFLQVFWTHA